MSNKHYVSGRKFEYRVRDFLEAKKYVVVRSAGSHTPIDLVAFDMHGFILVQCKHTNVRLSEIRDFIGLSKRYPDYNFYVATAERNGKNVDIVFYGVTQLGNLVRIEEF